MSVRSVFAGMALALGAILFPLGGAPGAAAQGPLTCLAEVDGALFDDEADFAGRLRSFAGPAGEIERRALSCPYVAEDGRRTELILEWDERPSGRFDCRHLEVVPQGENPATARLDHPTLQGSIRLVGPDAPSVLAMEEAARLTLEAVPAAAPACALDQAQAPSGPSAAGSDGRRALGVVAAVLIVLVGGGWALRRRRAATGTEVATDPERDAVRAELARTNAQLDEVEGALAGGQGAPTVPTPDPVLVSSLLADAATHGLDRTAAAAVLAQAQARPVSFRIAAAARCARPHRLATETTTARARLVERILQEGPLDADGSTATLAETRQRLLDTRRLLERRLTVKGER